jgi:hypothetical protein
VHYFSFRFVCLLFVFVCLPFVSGFFVVYFSLCCIFFLSFLFVCFLLLFLFVCLLILFLRCFWFRCVSFVYFSFRFDSLLFVWISIRFVYFFSDAVLSLNPSR